MASLLSRMEKPLLAAADKLGQQPHLNAVRDGVVGALPLVLIGSLFMLVAQPPFPKKEWKDAYEAIQIQQLPVPFQAVLFLVLVYALLTVAASLLVYRRVRAVGLRRSSSPLTVAVLAIGAAGCAAIIGGIVLGLLGPAIEGGCYHAAVISTPRAVFLVPQLALATHVLVGLIGLYVGYGVAASLARRYDLDALSASLLAAAALLLVNGRQLVPVAGLARPVKFVPMDNLGAGGLFLAIILGLLVPEVLRFAKQRKWEIRLPAGVPPAVGRSFSALFPGLLLLAPLWAIVHLLGIDLFGLINTVLSRPIEAVSATGPVGFVVMALIVFIDSAVWLLGIHAVAILAPMQAVWLNNIGTNLAAFAAGQIPSLINTREALQFFVWAGGSGATLVLPFLLLRARSASLRAVARVGALPALFNINEPLIFGIPVMLNPTLAIPFILAPLATLALTVAATASGLAPVPHLVVPWTLPAPIGAFLATGGSWKAAVLSTANIALAALIYWPFVRALDRRTAAGEGSGV